MRLRRGLHHVACAAGLAITSCGTTDRDIPSLVITSGNFELLVEGRGELQAVNSTKVAVPRELRGRQVVAWMLDDGTGVKAGDVVCRLDDTEALRQVKDGGVAVSKVDLQIDAKNKEQRQERRELDEKIEMTQAERELAARTAQMDQTIFSRNEIVDAQVSLEFLDKKGTILGSKRRRLDVQQRADSQLLDLQRQTHALKVQKVQETLTRMALVSPHDGVFLVATDWRGEKVRTGSQLWSGQEIGQLPDTSKMEALVHVLEAELAGATVGTPATVEIDAQPGVRYSGKIKSVSAVAAPKESDSPLKYFDVTIALDKTDTTAMKPGLKVHAELHVKQQNDVLTVPNQALFRQAERSWVYTATRSGYEQRDVKIGERSSTRTVITAGLSPGERIALSDPQASR